MSKTPNVGPRSAGLSDAALWDRIRAAALPASHDGSDFSRRLANAGDMPLVEAREVEEEYRRFLYLCTISDEPRVPPAPVRLAWSIHANAPEYSAFCAGTLKKPLPFDDAARLLGAAGAYQRMRADYLREFAAAPPREIWPTSIAPRMPRWLGAHAAILGFAAVMAWGRHEPLILAIGLGLSLLVYGVDLWSSRAAQRRRGIGEAANRDLSYWLKRSEP